ncbi:hypothetical protein SAMN05216429_10926 [Marinobacter persicus]|uniref:DUF1365 family protein n=1 Tax=Marinobacter persicus TaxID=930118 RepID=A0A1I3W556_9GAMM|nr:DUF1365 domain-containing protein [Marinobacter persicus]GHD46777.1 DUF1365 domain-containing protein [Marinobacter persicus]SFK02429.1 hypothetical protein SAMN05216429_10926 [Marinobacter persicus]
MATEWLEGTIRHRRKLPARHEFLYKIGMLALDLDDWTALPRLSPFLSAGRFNWVSLYREDYLDPEVPSLRTAVQQRVEAATGWQPDGPIQLLTHPRYLGYIFNPVSFYLCYQAGQHPENGDVPRVILAQITNTPWKERHVYCLECQRPGPGSPDTWQTERFAFSKRFHVSPFNGMNQHYQWLFSFRGPDLRIHMNVREDERKHFDATLVVRRSPFDRKTFHNSLVHFPLETIKGTAGIYWNALKLKLKGAHFYTHPDKLASDDPSYRKGSDDQGQDVTETPGINNVNNDQPARVSSWRT